MDKQQEAATLSAFRAVTDAPGWVLVQERRILVELVREVQCHRVRSRDCRICQLKDEFDKLNPSHGVVA